ncbi:MAG TPA: DUF1707 domain-containing protein [Streptosporangiaceae bacterium]|nr:DUF1707 domain-containing protein [Streptosporangiaceae bacterium]
MTTGPWDRKVVGARGGGHLRASDADREQVIDTLKDAFVQGRLTMDELGMRTGQALASRTYAELTAITADIPARPIEVPLPMPARIPARRPINKKAVACATCMIILPPALGAAFLTFYGGFIILFVFAFAGLVVASGP